MSALFCFTRAAELSELLPRSKSIGNVKTVRIDLNILSNPPILWAMPRRGKQSPKACLYTSSLKSRELFSYFSGYRDQGVERWRTEGNSEGSRSRRTLNSGLDYCRAEAPQRIYDITVTYHRKTFVSVCP